MTVQSNLLALFACVCGMLLLGMFTLKLLGEKSMPRLLLPLGLGALILGFLAYHFR